MARCGKKIILLLIVFLVVLGEGVRSFAQEASFYSITGPCNLSFPRDHGPHPGYRTEWWYYTGNLHSPAGDSYGFQLTFFRRQISPPGTERTWPRPASSWRTQQLFIVHAALTDIARNQFHHTETMSRELPGLATATREGGTTAISVSNWSLDLRETQHLLEGTNEAFAIRLTLTPSKAPVLHGDAGYSRKGSAPESASCYYSFSRLLAEGSLSLNGTPIPVRGTAWMDHEFSSAALESDISGWDWFSLQLADETELMLYFLRKQDGTLSPASAGTLIDASGKPSSVSRDDIAMEILDRWKSPRTGAIYPSGWMIKIPRLELELTVKPAIPDQELQTPDTTRITYWEGSVFATGHTAGKVISGQGYVELTGYAGTMGGRL